MANVGTTVMVPRVNVMPGTRVKHNGLPWRASANVNGYLYLSRVMEKTRTMAEKVEIYINTPGQLKHD